MLNVSKIYIKNCDHGLGKDDDIYVGYKCNQFELFDKNNQHSKTTLRNKNAFGLSFDLMRDSLQFIMLISMNGQKSVTPAVL